MTRRCVVDMAAGSVVRAERDWPFTELLGRPVHLACASEAEFALEAADRMIVVDGVAYWISNGQVPFGDFLALAHALGVLPSGINVRECEVARTAAALAATVAYCSGQPAVATDEERADLLAAFGPGELIVDAVSGRRTQL